MGNNTLIGLMKKHREALMLTQKQVADELHVAETTYQKWEVGTNRISVDYLGDLCKALKVSAHDLLGMEEPVLEVPIRTYAFDGFERDPKTNDYVPVNYRELPVMPREEADRKGYHTVGILMTASEAFTCICHMAAEPGLSWKDAHEKYVMEPKWQAATQAFDARAAASC